MPAAIRSEPRVRVSLCICRLASDRRAALLGYAPARATREHDRAQELPERPARGALAASGIRRVAPGGDRGELRRARRAAEGDRDRRDLDVAERDELEDV